MKLKAVFSVDIDFDITTSETHNVEFCAIFDPERNDVIWED